MLRKDIKAPQKIPLSRLRTNLIPICLQDLILFSQLFQVSSMSLFSRYLGFGQTYLGRMLNEKKREDMISDVVGIKLLMILNDVYRLVDENLPQQICHSILLNNDGYLNFDKPSKDESATFISKFYPNLLTIGKLTDPLSTKALREILAVAQIHPSKFFKLYDPNQEFPYIRTLIEMPDAIFDEDKAWRIWFVLGEEFGLVNKRKIIKKLNDLSLSHFNDFAKQRDRYQKWILEQSHFR